MQTLPKILHHKIIAIIRGAIPSDVIHIAKSLHEGGINIIEVTHNSPDALEVVRLLAKTLDGEMLIGMGTVLNADTAAKAIDVGAKFIISPSFDVETIHMTKKLGAVSIPGAYTATEILSAYNAGGDIIKVFPVADALYIKNLLAPLSHIPLMPTGGVNLENIHQFYLAGAVAFGVGSSLVNTAEEVTDEYLNRLSEKAKLFVNAINTADENKRV
jgi:2-dehydro-3-deoxyphosphogluconate aldolase / (4S)-4-hydroxy-2-oxoglutarate aldolase